LNTFTTLLSSAAKNDEAFWPLYTLPDFEKFGSVSRALSGALLLAFTPLVTNATRTQWEEYSVKNQWWIQEGLDDLGIDSTPRNITPFVYRKTAWSFEPELIGLEQYSPIWQMSPAPKDTSVVNFNLFSHPTFERMVEFANTTRQSAISEVLNTSLVFGTSVPQRGEHPQSIVVLPVFQETNNIESPIIGHVVAVIPWGRFFENILQDGHNGVCAVLKESCGNAFTYQIDGPNATFLGAGDLHDPAYDNVKRSTEFHGFGGELEGLLEELSDHCEYTISVYPSAQYEEEYETDRAIYSTIVVLLNFVFTSAVFLLYDCFVQRRQRKVNKAAVKSNAIVTSLFPAQVRDKLMDQEDDKRAKKPFKRTAKVSDAVTVANNSDITGGGDDSMLMDETGLVNNSPPIADLFPSATVLFMDIAGFTAWSSEREPCQVFLLLETIYQNFDKIAKQLRVFKVETIGDCYVAVCGLPEPCDEHAIVMARFTRDCLEKMNELVRKLETTLGPDTANLAMRAGLHSGPVTAGVLRGDRARFQLFGDTVNTAARMESTGAKNKIQISQDTAELIIASGKPSWIKPRKDTVHAKGKGELQTFWILPKQDVTAPHYMSSEGTSETEHVGVMEGLKAEGGFSEHSMPEAAIAGANERTQRLVDYTSDIMLAILKKIVAKRATQAKRTSEADRNIRKLENSLGKTGICLEEVVEAIELPKVDSVAYNHKNIEISNEIISQLRSFIKMVASMYRSNPFHNFDHATHVTQSTCKLLSRIVAIKHIEEAEKLHDHTYGITSNPLTEFAIVFSSLIHDVDHRGVPNFLLVKEDPALGALYRNQAVAEQNSIDVAWNLLMDPSFEALREAIYSDESELRRFRQLVVNSLMATDIFDKELAALRRKRWDDAFFVEHEDEDPQISINRKATIVIEHIVQASDVSHTMQHWHVYSKWNEQLYREMFSGYCQGCSDKDPTPGWYEGELRFFDNYVIPLAHKLKECGVFGVSSDEYLNYAMANRREWEKKGRDIVAANFEKYRKELKDKPTSFKGEAPEAAPLSTH
jgi:class 3 adenylate cyclase